MTTIHQCCPPIEMETPKGYGHCLFLIDPGQESPAQWVVMQEDGQIWWWQNSQVRGCRNFSAGRPDPERPAPMPELDRYKRRPKGK